MQVWTYPERKYEELGARRWDAEWYNITPAAQARLDADPNYEIDFDRDIETLHRTFPTKALAMAFARKQYAKSFFGQVDVCEQVVDWYVEEDRVAEWVNCGDVESVN